MMSPGSIGQKRCPEITMSVLYILLKVDREPCSKDQTRHFLGPWMCQNVGALLIGPEFRAMQSDAI